MAIPAGAVKIVLAGTLPEGEIWETGFWMRDTGVNSAASATALAFVIKATLSATDDSGAMLITLQAAAAVQTTWTEVRAYAYNGGPTAEWTGQSEVSPALIGAAGNPLPNQLAAVLTLRTGLAGRRHRGRMYLPVSGVGSMTTDGQLSGSVVDSITDGWATGFSDINASSAGTIVVMSNAASATTDVSAVTMDTRFDIQRRRANRQIVRGSETKPVTS